MHDIVPEYYGKQLRGSTDLKTTACSDFSSMPNWFTPAEVDSSRGTVALLRLRSGQWLQAIDRSMAYVVNPTIS